jgi:phage terminase large subunit-like protein
MGPPVLFPSEGRRVGDFLALKNPTTSASFEPANLGTRNQHASSNSQLLVFYSKQFHIRIYGNATNWNEAGYWDEIYGEPSKFSVVF